MRIGTLATSLALGLALGSAPVAFANGPKPPATKTKPKKSVAVSAEHKKALAELYGGFKFGMSKDEVLAVLQKQIDDRYEDKIKDTTDVAMQDKLRRDKKAELGRVSGTYIAFDTQQKTGWDVSIIEQEFAHGTNEALMDHWENQGGKNQRRFFFFYQGKLWKMFISLDVSILPADKKNFDTFRGVMEKQYGAGDVDVGLIQWNAGEFDVRAVDRLKDYDALGLAIEDTRTRTELEALRAQNAPKAHETSSVIKAVIDPDNKDHPGVKANDGAVDAVIKAQGGK
ncbi:MAG TPA: hypothetical protein VMJ10_20070 [Kofleriaceae bacterium]|nr:hypothetical protein [Kofleriaceae bacterium]